MQANFGHAWRNDCLLLSQLRVHLNRPQLFTNKRRSYRIETTLSSLQGVKLGSYMR